VPYGTHVRFCFIYERTYKEKSGQKISGNNSFEYIGIGKESGFDSPDNIEDGKGNVDQKEFRAEGCQSVAKTLRRSIPVNGSAKIPSRLSSRNVNYR